MAARISRWIPERRLLRALVGNDDFGLNDDFKESPMKKLIAGNWKMNGTLSGAIKLARDVVEDIRKNPDILTRCDFLVCPPALHLVPVAAELSAAVALGAQDCSRFDNGAYTGDVSAPMLKDIGCTYAILGHSERRQYFGDTDAAIRQKAEKAQAAGLIALICVGETQTQREEGQEEAVVGEQLKNALPAGCTAENTVIAYEPVWAIGTGKVATAEDIRKMHAFIRNKVADKGIRILYGGSVKPANAGEIFAIPHVDGALIGGASLKSSDFMGIASEVKKGN